MRVVASKARRITGENGLVTVILKGDTGLVSHLNADSRGPTLTVDWDHSLRSDGLQNESCVEEGVDPRQVRLMREED
jgi:hypothetical protein